MNLEKNYSGIPTSIQAKDIPMSESIEDRVQKLVNRLSRYYPKILKAEIFMEDKKGKATDSRSVGIRLDIPGNDVYAKDSGENFMALFTSVEEKLRSQLEKK